MPTGTAVWAAIVDDIARGRLPPTAELVLEENSVPVALRTGLFAPFNARIRYPFMAADTTVYRVPLTSAQVAAFAAVHAEQTIGAAAATQIETDHRDFANAIRYSGTNRDPCNGIFNHSYEFVLAVGRMLSDAGQVRAFGAFATFAAGDMQHFDYGHGHR